MMHVNEAALCGVGWVLLRAAVFLRPLYLRLKMADGESTPGKAFPGSPETEEPAKKRSKIGPATNPDYRVPKTDEVSCASGATESWKTAVNCLQPAEKEAKPGMAAEEAPGALSEDNNRLPLPDPKPDSEPHTGTEEDNEALQTTEEGAGKTRERDCGSVWTTLTAYDTHLRTFPVFTFKPGH